MRGPVAQSPSEVFELQLELLRGDAVSLHSLWRAAGSPPRRDPGRWVDAAARLVAGFREYLEAVEGPEADGPRPVLWTWEGEHGEPWLRGDLMAHEVLARAYLAYLRRARPEPRVDGRESRGGPGGRPS